MTDLGYYDETILHGVREPTGRKPDSLLYRRGVAGSPRLTKEAQTMGALVSFEHKANLRDKRLMRKALSEIERDAALKTIDNDIFEPKVGYCVITDGIEWHFCRLYWVLDSSYYSSKFTHMAQKSDAIIVTPSVTKPTQFAELAKWLLFILRRSLEDPVKSSGFEKKKFEIVPGKEITVNQFLTLERISRPVVAKVSIARDTNYVLKFLSILSDSKSDQEKNFKQAKRLVVERKNLMRLAKVPHIVSLAEDEAELLGKKPFAALLLEDAGIPLDKHIISGKAGQNLAKLVYNDIWKTALPKLREMDLCFADIHPGNICAKKNKATLVDVESVKTKGESLDRSPILLRYGETEDQELAPHEADMEWDQVSLAAILRCLWEDGSFDKLKKYVFGYKNDKKGMNDFIESFEWKN